MRNYTLENIGGRRLNKFVAKDGRDAVKRAKLVLMHRNQSASLRRSIQDSEFIWHPGERSWIMMFTNDHRTFAYYVETEK